MSQCQMSNNAPPIGIPSQQLARSKSLNDISNDSQISAFASDRFINLHNNGVTIPPDAKEPTQTCMPTSPFIYEDINSVNIHHNAMCTTSNNIFNTISYDNSRNLNNNQCSRSTTGTVFDLCNPLAINLSGVTEQIGNLHL